MLWTVGMRYYFALDRSNEYYFCSETLEMNVNITFLFEFVVIRTLELGRFLAMVLLKDDLV